MRKSPRGYRCWPTASCYAGCEPDDPGFLYKPVLPVLVIHPKLEIRKKRGSRVGCRGEMPRHLPLITFARVILPTVDTFFRPAYFTPLRLGPGSPEADAARKETLWRRKLES